MKKGGDSSVKKNFLENDFFLFPGSFVHFLISYS